jgi:hypothetical protein
VYTKRCIRRLLALTSLGGTVFASGCYSVLEQNLDILLSPAASGNLLALPTSPVAPLIEFLLKAFRG